MNQEIRVAVLQGGLSSEREVSLATGKAVEAALRRKGYKVFPVDVDENTPVSLSRDKPEVAFNALHGKFGEDGTIQGLLELLRIPYTGSGVLPSALAMDKVLSKRIFAQEGVPVASYSVVRYGDMEKALESAESFDYPLVVKPRAEGSSVGITLVREPGAMAAALEEAFVYDEAVLLEAYIQGREIQLGFIDGRVLGAIEVIPSNAFYDYEAKYTPGKTRYVSSPELPDGALESMAAYAQRVIEVMGCEGGIRVDFILGADDTPYILEVNTLPGMTELSLFPKIASQAGLSFDDLVENLLLGARLKL